MFTSKKLIPAALFLALAGVACSPEAPDAMLEVPDAKAESNETAIAATSVVQNPLKEAYFGNFHVHTSYSFDGYTNGSVTSPDDAYRWAKGEAIPGGGPGEDQSGQDGNGCEATQKPQRQGPARA